MVDGLGSAGIEGVSSGGAKVGGTNSGVAGLVGVRKAVIGSWDSQVTSHPLDTEKLQIRKQKFRA